MQQNRILGVNAFHGDASAAVFAGGELRTAMEEERLLRIKHWAGLPAEVSKRCMSEAGIETIDHVAVSRDPKAHTWSKIKRVATQPKLWGQAAGRAVNSRRILQIGEELESRGVAGAAKAKFHLVEHHRSHMASAFFASPFEEAAIVSVDGFGDFSSVMWGVGKGNQFEVKGCVRFPHSLGLFYTAFTQFLGFPNYGDEYKMMGLSAYGEPVFKEKVRQVVKLDGDQVVLNLDLFRHHNEGVEMTWDNGEPKLGKVYNERFVEIFGEERQPRTELLQKHRDMAASAQAVLEEIYLPLLNYVHKQTGMKAVCLAGGVALNCVANGMIFAKTGFQDVYVQPAAHDAGTSIGAAMYVWHQVLNQPRREQMRHVYYGTTYDEARIEQALKEAGANYEKLAEPEMVRQVAQLIADGNVMGWFQGRMEFGPRALGNRSILADPRRTDMQDILNQRIKFRETFRPFCPSILAEKVGVFFETDYPSPFMVMAYKIKAAQQPRIPAVTHQDGTGRLQTVEKDVNPLYWKLLTEFDRIAGVPILINTSFNENEPIVETPAQAIDCFLRTKMDALGIGPFLLKKCNNQKV